MISARSRIVLGFLLIQVFAGGFAQVPHPAGISVSEFSLASPMRVLWQFKSDETINLTPASDGKQVFVPMSSGGIVALSLDSGKLAWKENVGGEISADPVACDFGVFVANEVTTPKSSPAQSSGAVRALSRESGITLWLRTLPSPIRGSLVINDGVLYGASSDGQVYSINIKTGSTNWSIQLPVSFASHPVIVNGRMYLGSEGGMTFAVDIKKGTVIWRYQTHGAIRAKPAVSESTVAIASSDGYIYGLEPNDGALHWKARTGAAVQSVTVSKDFIIAASLDNFAYCFGEAKGTRIWKRQLEGRPLAEPLMDGNSIMFNPISGLAAVVLDTRDGKILNSLPTGEDNNSGAAPVLAGGKVMLTTREGLVAFSPAK